MAQKQRKTVPQNIRPERLPATEEGQLREFLKSVPQLSFLLPPEKRQKRRFRAVKSLFGKILGALVPSLAHKDPELLSQLLQQEP